MSSRRLRKQRVATTTVGSTTGVTETVGRRKRKCSTRDVRTATGVDGATVMDSPGVEDGQEMLFLFQIPKMGVIIPRTKFFMVLLIMEQHILIVFQ